VPVHYDAARFEHDFLVNWPSGSAAHTSYHSRIVHGPDYGADQAVRRHAAPIGAARLQPIRQENPI